MIESAPETAPEPAPAATSSDRNRVTFADRAGYDLSYLKTQSLFADIGYLLRTVATVCRMSGR